MQALLNKRIDRSAQSGFTLIELMIVVAIIGILAAIAIPAYQNYIHSAQASELVTMSAPAKQAISKYVMINGDLPKDNSDGDSVSDMSTVWNGFGKDANGNYNTHTEYVNSLKWDSNKSRIVVDARGAIDGLTMYLDATLNGGEVTWTCKVKVDESKASSDWIPSHCKEYTGGGTT